MVVPHGFIGNAFPFTLPPFPCCLTDPCRLIFPPSFTNTLLHSLAVTRVL